MPPNHLNRSTTHGPYLRLQQEVGPNVSPVDPRDGEEHLLGLGDAAPRGKPPGGLGHGSGGKRKGQGGDGQLSNKHRTRIATQGIRHEIRGGDSRSPVHELVPGTRQVPKNLLLD